MEERKVNVQAKPFFPLTSETLPPDSAEWKMKGFKGGEGWNE